MKIISKIVTKPTSKSSEPPPRPAVPAVAPNRASIPPPRPSQSPNVVRANNGNNEQPSVADYNEAMPDVTQKSEIDLLNLSSSRGSNSVANKNLPSEPSFDLLGGFESAEARGNNTMPDLLSDSQTKAPQGLDDIFGAFNQPPANAPPSNPNLPDLGNIGLNFNAFASNASANQNQNPDFDPFGNESFGNNAELLQPTSKETSPSQPKQPNLPTAQANKDPFADIGNLASGLNLQWNAGNANTNSNKTTPVISPSHQFGAFPSSASVSPHAPSTPVSNRTPSDSASQLKPDYSRSHFEQKTKQNGAQNTASPSVSASASATGDIFADILGQQGYSFAAKAQAGPRSINEMRKEELVKDMDPDKLKIMEWVSNN